MFILSNCKRFSKLLRKGLWKRWNLIRSGFSFSFSSVLSGS